MPLAHRFYHALLGRGGGLPVAGATLWVKSDTGLYESDDVSDPCEAGDPIRLWVDQSGAGNHLTNADVGSTSKPTWDSSTQHLSRNTVRFDPSVTFRFLRVPDMFDGLSSGELFATLKMAADPGVGSNLGLWNLYTAGAVTHHPYSDGSCYDGTLSTARKTVGNLATALTNWHVWNIRSAASDWEAYLDNTSVHATATNTFGPPTGVSLIGISDGAGTWRMDGWMAELVFFPFTLDSSQRADVYDQLANG